MNKIKIAAGIVLSAAMSVGSAKCITSKLAEMAPEDAATFAVENLVTTRGYNPELGDIIANEIDSLEKDHYETVKSALSAAINEKVFNALRSEINDEMIAAGRSMFNAMHPGLRDVNESDPLYGEFFSKQLGYYIEEESPLNTCYKMLMGLTGKSSRGEDDFTETEKKIIELIPGIKALGKSERFRSYLSFSIRMTEPMGMSFG